MVCKTLAVSLVILALSTACKKRSESASEESGVKTSARVATVGAYLNRLANTQYGVLLNPSVFTVNGQPINIAVEGCSHSYFQLKKYGKPEWDQKAEQLNAAVLKTLDETLQASRCSFKDGDMAKAFPEFEAFDQYWNKAYSEKAFLTDEEYAEQAEHQPEVITKEELVKRLSCLGAFAIQDLPQSQAPCAVTQNESALLDSSK